MKKHVDRFFAKPDYAKKAEILKTDLCKKVGQLDKQRFEYERDGVIPSIDFDFEEWSLYAEKGYNKEDIEEARKINRSSFYRVRRLKERIENYLSKSQCIWLTLTFNDDTLAKTSQETRRKYVARYLKSQSNYYVANIDFGKENEREHYHAVVVGDHLDLGQWLYGYAFTERIKNHINAPFKLSKYVSKLTNHAIKETTKRQCYIYSR